MVLFLGHEIGAGLVTENGSEPHLGTVPSKAPLLVGSRCLRPQGLGSSARNSSPPGAKVQRKITPPPPFLAESRGRKVCLVQPQKPKSSGTSVRDGSKRRALQALLAKGHPSEREGDTFFSEFEGHSIKLPIQNALRLMFCLKSSCELFYS